MPKLYLADSLEHGLVQSRLMLRQAQRKWLRPIYEVSGYERALFGRGPVILRDNETGVLCGGSDPRADGYAGIV